MSSIGEARAAFKAVIDGIDGLKYFATTPPAPRAGDCWLRWRANKDEDLVAYEVTWSLVVCTDQGEAAADAWVDEHIDGLVRALRPVATVTSYAPANVGPSGANPVFGLLITMNRE